MAIATDSALIILCNLGAVIYIATKVVDKVDKHQEILPGLVKAIENINKSSGEHLTAIQDLYKEHKELAADFYCLLGEHKATDCGRRETDAPSMWRKGDRDVD